MFGKEIKEISVQELKKINNKKSTIIDVREPNEFETKHIPNAKNVPYKTLIKHPAEFIDGPVFIICNNGNSSKRAVKKLSKNYDVTNVKGGTNAYGHHFGLIRTSKLQTEKTKK